MTKIPPRRQNLTPELCQVVHGEMLAACRRIAKKHGLAVDDRGISDMGMHLGFEATLRVSIPLSDGRALDPQRMHFELFAATYGLSPADYGREFSSGRDRFRIIGIETGRPKYPISAERIADRRRFKFTAEQVALMLTGAMKDITPPA